MPEFVNPKYADESRASFKAPARLECMMQDFPKLLGGDAKIGYAQFEESYYSPVKNNPADAVRPAPAARPLARAPCPSLGGCAAIAGEQGGQRAARRLPRDGRGRLLQHGLCAPPPTRPARSAPADVHGDAQADC